MLEKKNTNQKQKTRKTTTAKKNIYLILAMPMNTINHNDNYNINNNNYNNNYYNDIYQL